MSVSERGPRGGNQRVRGCVSRDPVTAGHARSETVDERANSRTEGYIAHDKWPRA
jgi:hypothetical protein